MKTDSRADVRTLALLESGAVRARSLLLVIVAFGACVSSVWVAFGNDSSDPRKAAKSLVAELRPKRACNFGASRVTSRHGRLWLAVSDACSRKGTHAAWPDTRVRVFLWSGREWRLDGTVTGPLSGGQWVGAASLTGSRAPDFTITSCGAGGITCMSVISKAGGRWRAVPFEYGYGTSLVVDGAAVGRLVLTTSASYEPPTHSYHRYVNGTFVPADPPGPAPKCGKSALQWAATSTRAIRFNHVGCEAGWALAVGEGAGLTGQTVGLFEWDADDRSWRTQTLDNGNLLPATPSMFKLPLTLLTRLAAPAGAKLAPEVAAAKLIGGLESRQPDEFSWPPQNGIVEAGGRRWLVAVIPDGPDPDASTHASATATIYRWDETQWVTDGQIPNLNQALNVSWRGGWYVSVPQEQPSNVAFQLVGACCKGTDNDEHRSGRLITNAGGSWHVT